jgi:nucleotide-binding universal stress UspA family protein
MSFADILMPVAPTAEDELVRLAVAVDLAQRLKARLNGVFVATNLTSRREASWARSLFDRAVSLTSLETTWRVIDGREMAPLLFQARRTDLVVMPPAEPVVGSDSQRPELIALQSGVPTLVLPHPKNEMSIGHKILVGWNETREATRAIHDALPILENADKVWVLSVTPDDGPEPLGERRLVDHLTLHGAPIELARRHGDPGEEIAASALDLDVDMLVLGLKRRGNDLGDVSSRFVRSMTFPILFSH